MQIFVPSWKAKFRSVVVAPLVAGLWAVGCAGNIDPSLLPQGSGGTGSPQGTAGTSGGTACNAPAMVLSTARCAGAGCHSSTQPQGVDLMSPGLVARLLNVKPTTGACMPGGMAYLTPGSTPATGLLLDKLKATPSCGLTMPFGGLGGALNDSELACVNDWATAVTTGRITQ